MMDLQVAVFLIIFLSLSSLATIGICFVEIRSCWRQYRFRVETQKLRRLNLTVEHLEEVIEKDAAAVQQILEHQPLKPLEPSTPYLFQHLDHLDMEHDKWNHHVLSPPVSEPAYHMQRLYHDHQPPRPEFGLRRNLDQDDFEDATNNHHFIYASHHRTNHMGIGAFV